MELRTNRSRSRTPLLHTEGEKVTYEQQQILTEETVIQHSLRNRNIVSTSTDEVFISPQKKIKPIRRSTELRARQKTSDYSSEEGENEISSSSRITQEDGNRTRLSTYTVNKSSNGQAKTAFQVYKEAGEYWNKFPKTDYTYSRHSKDRFEVAPGVVAMPNMSRRSLHRDIDISQLSSQTNKSQYYSGTNEKHYEDTQLLHARLEPRKLFEDELVITTRITRTITRSIISIYTSILTILTVIYKSNTKAMLWFGKGYYRFVSRMLLLDTWLLQSNVSHRRRMGALLALFLIPLFILAGIHLAQARDVKVAPSCYPNCGYIASRYINSAFDAAQDAIYTIIRTQ